MRRAAPSIRGPTDRHPLAGAMNGALESPPLAQTRPRPRARRALHALGAGLLACVVLEAVVRFLVLSPACADWGIARRLRNPNRFGRVQSDDAPAILSFLWLPEEKRTRRPPWCPSHDARVGWTSELFRPGDYAHVEEAKVGGRRPVLLFGNSFAACVTDPGTRFQDLLEESPLGQEFALLNYGVPGYGLDQTWLLLREVLARRPAEDAVVVVGLLVDDDLDRCLLTFRNWPKPRLRVEDGRLIDPGTPVPSVDEFFAGDPELPASYAWALLAGALRDREERGTPAQEAEKQALTRALLAAVADELRQRDLECFFVLFNASAATADPGVLGWRQDLVRSELTRLGIRFTEARDDLLRAAEDAGGDLSPYFRFGDDHLDVLGNAVAFGALERGLTREGR